jgi:hypothetical protein
MSKKEELVYIEFNEAYDYTMEYIFVPYEKDAFGPVMHFPQHPVCKGVKIIRQLKENIDGK